MVDQKMCVNLALYWKLIKMQTSQTQSRTFEIFCIFYGECYLNYWMSALDKILGENTGRQTVADKK